MGGRLSTGDGGVRMLPFAHHESTDGRGGIVATLDAVEARVVRQTPVDWSRVWRTSRLVLVAGPAAAVGLVVGVLVWAGSRVWAGFMVGFDKGRGR